MEKLAASLYFIERDPSHPDAAMLLSELSDILCAITGCDGRASFDARDVRGEGGAFLVAYLGEVAVACGGFRPLTGGIAEVKRVYARERGAGLPTLRALEKLASAQGYTQLVCETRRVNLRAVSFYVRAGWLETAPYGHYIGRPEAICFAKTLLAIPSPTDPSQ